MERYKNLGGDSGIVGYEIDADSIEVAFSDGKQYLYDYASTGSHNIETMKSMAVAGQGLNAFINTTVRKGYARRTR